MPPPVQLSYTPPEAASPSRTCRGKLWGLLFERRVGSGGTRWLTFEPRLMYLYAPYRNQDNLPVFDTAEPDLNWVELFRTNRYVGLDRISDANQVSVGFTSRLFDAGNGTRYLAATLGQTFHFESPRVRLPEEPLTGRERSEASVRTPQKWLTGTSKK